MTAFTVSARLLAAVSKWTCHDESRHHLNFVFFDGKEMVATDGHRLVAVPHETGLPPFGLHRKDINVITAAFREVSKRGNLTITIDGRRATLKLVDQPLPEVVVSAPIVDFPPYEQLFAGLKRETETPPEYAFNPRFLSDIGEVLDAADLSDTVRIKAWTRIESDGICGPMLFDGSGIRFLVMAKRGL